MISDEDVARYQRDGYLVIPDVLSAREVDDLRRATEAQVERSRQAIEARQMRAIPVIRDHGCASGNRASSWSSQATSDCGVSLVTRVRS